jgi:hypothetical protein
MKSILYLGLAMTCAASLCAAEADARTALKNAAKKLGEKDNYAWTLSSKNEAGDQRFQMGTDGKTQKVGFTQMNITLGENIFRAVRKGDKLVMELEGEWKTPEEMEDRQARMVRRLKDSKLPAAEAEDLADKAKELKAGEEGLYSGDLTEQGVKELFARWRRGGQAAEPTGAKGWVKFWVKDGLLTKYQFNVQGTITTGQDQREMEVNRTTTVDIKDVGTTKVTIPDEAKKKLS